MSDALTDNAVADMMLFEAACDGAMNTIRIDYDASVEGAFASIMLDWDFDNRTAARAAHYQAHESADNNATIMVA